MATAKLALDPEVAACPMSALNASPRQLISRTLNIEVNSLTCEGHSKDWKGLAELLGYMHEEILEFERFHEDPTKRVLLAYGTQRGATIGSLWEALLSLERADFPDASLCTRINDSVRFYIARMKSAADNFHNPLQDPEVGSGSDQRVDETKNLTIGELRTGEPEYFDAFICACDTDAHFVKQMLSQLEGEQYGLKLCYLPRDLTVGSSSYTALCFLIRERCNKMIVVLSPNFNESDQCDFLLKFAHSLEPSARMKKIIPVIYKTSRRHSNSQDEVPLLLRHITAVNFTKPDFQEYFWMRLASSLKDRPKYLPPPN